MASLMSIGRPVGHIEGPAKVTGRTLYSADVVRPGMLWGKCLRSPYPHARIVSIDVSEARRLPGVHAVATGADLPDLLLGQLYLDIPILARDVVRFVGEKVVAVAAESADIAEAALRLVEVEYQELPAVTDPLAAMEERSPRVHDKPAKLRQNPPIPPYCEVSIYPPIPNVVSRLVCRHGDAKAGIAAAHRAFEHRFSVPGVHQGYLEPHACTVALEPGGMVDIWFSNKSPFVARQHLAGALGLPEERIRVRQVAIGGDFGGKRSLMDSVLCYHLAQRAGRPVKMVMTYMEELTAGNPRHPAVIKLHTGVDRDGRITALEAKVVYNCGAYAAFIPWVTLHGAMEMGGSYRIPNLEIEVLRVYTNSVPGGHMRTPGALQATFALESHLDMIAHEMGLDPVEFRRRNAIADGDLSPLGVARERIRCKETLELAVQAAGWDQPKRANVGRGIGLCELEAGWFGKSSATITINPDATMTVLTGAPDTGTGFYTILQQIVAESFRVPLDDVAVVQGDTETGTFEVGPGGSRLTNTGGQAVLAAARALTEALSALAAQRLNCEAAQITSSDGRFLGAGGQSLDLKELMEWAGKQGAAPLTRTGWNDLDTANTVTCFTSQIAEVEVDPETGQVHLRRVVTAHDVGTVINPLTHQGQIEGGVVQAIGQALSEQLVVSDGVVTTAHLGDYKMPTAMDIPELETVLLETKGSLGPFEGKAIGEMSNVALPAAIANAVFDAVGVRLLELPVTAEKIHAGLRKMEGSK